MNSISQIVEYNLVDDIADTVIKQVLRTRTLRDAHLRYPKTIFEYDKKCSDPRLRFYTNIRIFSDKQIIKLHYSGIKDCVFSLILDVSVNTCI